MCTVQMASRSTLKTFSLWCCNCVVYIHLYGLCNINNNQQCYHPTDATLVYPILCILVRINGWSHSPPYGILCLGEDFCAAVVIFAYSRRRDEAFAAGQYIRRDWPGVFSVTVKIDRAAIVLSSTLVQTPLVLTPSYKPISPPVSHRPPPLPHPKQYGAPILRRWKLQDEPRNARSEEVARQDTQRGDARP